MGILEEVRAEIRTRTTSCSVCAWIEEQSPEDRATWETAFRDKTFPTTAIFRAMKKHNFKIKTDQPVATHRRTHMP